MSHAREVKIERIKTCQHLPELVPSLLSLSLSQATVRACKLVCECMFVYFILHIFVEFISIVFGCCCVCVCVVCLCMFVHVVAIRFNFDAILRYYKNIKFI